MSRVLVAACEFILGLIFGAIMTFGHQAEVSIGTVGVPWGIIAACFGVAALLIGYRLLSRNRWAVIWVALGIIMAVLVLSLPGPGGSVLVPAGVVGIIWSIAPTCIAALVIAWPAQLRTARVVKE